ncbi:tetratricopeptide repeat protein [Corallibacter sp.]|uniref:tetratricopeptide repeat protein n=1 Tax=Corallibacter sp. TaxID=2038084 RepID=UPI003AB4DB9B
MQHLYKAFRCCCILIFCNLQLEAQTLIDTSSVVNKELLQLKYNLQAAKLANNDKKESQAYIQLGDFYNQLKLKSEAVKNYQLYLSLNNDKDTSLVYVKNAIAAINVDLKNYNEAINHLHESLSISEKINDLKGKANANALFGTIEEKKGDYKRALAYQNKSLNIFKKLQDSTGLAVSNENIGSIYEDLEQYDLAYQYFKKAFVFSKNSDSHIRINIINNLGDVNRKQGYYNKALTYTSQALDLARATNNFSQIESALKDLARIYAGKEDFEQAYNYLNQQSTVNEQELKLHNAELVSAMQVRYDVKEKEAALEILNKQNQINKVQKYIIITITGAIILTFIIGFLYLKKRRKHEKAILEYKQQLLQADLDKKITEETALKREIDIKISSLTNYSLHIAHKNKMLSDVSKTLTKIKGRNSELIKSKIQQLVEEIEADLSHNNEWTELMGYFGQIHPNFFESLKQVATSKLSASEMRLCMLLRLNLSSKEIAEVLRITSDSVRIARYRLRKKLPLNSKEDLQAYLLNL